MAWIKTPYTREHAGKVYVGARDHTDPRNRYDGPMAEISADKTWVYIVTDPYEGSVMLNIEALPNLIAALQALLPAAPNLSGPQRSEAALSATDEPISPPPPAGGVK